MNKLKSTRYNPAVKKTVLRLKMKNSLWIISICLMLISCEKNPFSNTKISPETRSIKGTIRLADEANPAGTYIWLEQYNIATRADASGDFTLKIPPSLRGGSASGTFNVYFYMANYLIDSAKVAIRNDAVIFGEEDVNGKGNLILPSPLQKFLNVTTTTSPQRLSQKSVSTVTITTDLSAMKDSVTVVIPSSYSGGPLGIVFMREIETNNIFVFHALTTFQASELALVTVVPKSKALTFNFANFPIPQGKYEIIPFLYPSHQKLPQGLLDSFGEFAFQPGIYFLNIPFERDYTVFEVTE
ncbi:MAG: hypothetical protein DWQ10_09910 [Calditrichaeota bacterium]|nr:MAG: hypothetical protein DWQ10_09910 [Calditrichota bacterium]